LRNSNLIEAFEQLEGATISFTPIPQPLDTLFRH